MSRAAAFKRTLSVFAKPVPSWGFNSSHLGDRREDLRTGTLQFPLEAEWNHQVTEHLWSLIM